MSAPVAYYNENDPFAAQWLRNLISAGHIAPGDVDERDIRDVRPTDLVRYTQCHFFAGIGVWSYALRLAGWPDDRPVWTGSCPCPPFSAAGKGSQCPSCGGRSCLAHPLVTAGWICLDCRDVWAGDDRHLLPEFERLIGQCGPPTVFGEQVASKDGRAWFYTLRAVMERMGFAIGSADLCAAGVGSPNIRQRIFFTAHNLQPAASWLGHANSPRTTVGISEQEEWQKGLSKVDDNGSDRLFRPEPGRPSVVRLANRDSDGCDQTRECSTSSRNDGLERDSAVSGVASTHIIERNIGTGLRDSEPGKFGRNEFADSSLDRRPSPTNGFWRDADWLFCRDGKWRPVEPGTFPLVAKSANRVGRLRGYGNAINAQVAKTFIEACMQIQGEPTQ
ncbi:MAG: DNA cytosine methyltransferase [Hyphomicrobiales bacterium]|nr:MAG: DNA cytosine methyltransferase [Hyphomicrobiales bacterium]